MTQIWLDASKLLADALLTEVWIVRGRFFILFLQGLMILGLIKLAELFIQFVYFIEEKLKVKE